VITVRDINIDTLRVALEDLVKEWKKPWSVRGSIRVEVCGSPLASQGATISSGPPLGPPAGPVFPRDQARPGRRGLAYELRVKPDGARKGSPEAGGFRGFWKPRGSAYGDLASVATAFRVLAVPNREKNHGSRGAAERQAHAGQVCASIILPAGQGNARREAGALRHGDELLKRTAASLQLCTVS
jgi:hypothetical protein